LGDGRAFKAQCQCKGNTISIAYLFRVRNLMTVVDYMGPASAGDTQTQAVGFARKQEAKMFAAFAPPPATPTVIPTVEPTPTPLPVTTSAPPTVTDATSATAPHCQPGEQPRFHFGFATLSALLGPRMGNATSCEYNDPNGSGDVLQTTDTGLAIYRAGTATATFTNGSEHWALSGSSVVHWTASSLDPPADAEQMLG
jgi:hypothetical protein